MILIVYLKDSDKNMIKDILKWKKKGINENKS